MKKIYTIRDLPDQQAYMWDGHHIEDEVSVCSQRNILSYLVKYLPKNQQILEAGCGLGAWVIYLKEKGYNIEGIDHDEKVISTIKKFKPHLSIMTGDICHLHYPDNYLGAYTSLGVVEHFEEGTERPLAEALRILKPGGVVILTVPFNSIFRRLVAHPLRFFYLLVHRVRGGEIHFAEYRYSEVEVRRMLAEAGFQVIETDIDDFIPKSRSIALWSEFPFLQDHRKPYSLNLPGKILAYLMNSISRKIIGAGILVIARKP